jgi:hypothetical protein
MGIDEGFKVYLLTAEGSVESDTNEKNEAVTADFGESIEEAVSGCNAKSSGELFFGHTVVCVVSDELIKDRDSLEEAVRFMESETQISRRIIMLSADNPYELLSSTGEGKDIADFVGRYYKSHKSEKAVELDKLCRALAEGEGIEVPTVRVSESGFEIE